MARGQVGSCSQDYPHYAPWINHHDVDLSSNRTWWVCSYSTELPAVSIHTCLDPTFFRVLPLSAAGVVSVSPPSSGHTRYCWTDSGEEQRGHLKQWLQLMWLGWGRLEGGRMQGKSILNNAFKISDIRMMTNGTNHWISLTWSGWHKIQWLLPFVTNSLHWVMCTNSSSDIL